MRPVEIAVNKLGLKTACFDSGSARLAYYDTGPAAAQPLLSLSGGPGFDTNYLWVGSAYEQLARNRRLVFYDQRGTGKSSPFTDADNFTIADYVGDIETLRRTLGVASFDLLGHSFGGYLAMAYAVEHPQRVRRLLLLDSVAPRRAATTFTFHEAFPERYERYRAWSAALVRGDAATGKELAHVYHSMLFYDTKMSDAWREEIAGIGFNPVPTGVLWAEANGPDLSDSIRQLAMPALVMTGRYDMNISARTAWTIKNALRDARFHVFERSGHLPFFEEPDAFAAVVDEFLQKS